MVISFSQQDLKHSRSAARLAFSALNNAGKGFDPEWYIETYRLERPAEHDEDVSVYSYTDDDGYYWVILVGDANGLWGVAVGEAGIDVEL